MNKQQLLLAAVLSIICHVCAQQGQHTVVAMVLKKGVQKLPEIKVNGVNVYLHAPQGNQGTQEPGAPVQGPPSDTATFIVGHKDADSKSSHPPPMAAALLVPSASKPKTEHEKIMDELKLTKEEKGKLFPCEDYVPYCKNYAVTKQCRDVYTQKNCRKSCNLCNVPWGVFIGCQDLDICKKFASTACMVRWVRETCKSKCGQCGYERQANSHIVMGKKRHFPGAKSKKSYKTAAHKHEEKHSEKKHDKTKQLQKVLKKITKKGKDEVKKAAVKIKKVKEDLPKKPHKAEVKTNYKPEVQHLKPEVAVDEKPVPKDEEDDREESREESKAAVEKNDKNDSDDDDEDDDSNADDDDDDTQDNGKVQESSGSSQDEDDDEDETPKASKDSKTHDHLAAPMKIDADPRGEPVVTKLVQQPIKFNDAPVKNVKIVKQKKVVKDAQPKVEKKNVSKKVNSDKVEKKGKHVKRVQKN